MFETKFSGNNKIWGALPPRLQACPTFLGDFWSRGLLKILGWRVSHARCTTNGMCAKNSTYMQVARTSIITITHFTLHCYRIDAWAIRGSWLTFVNALANSILGRFYTARNSKICFVRLVYGIAKAGEKVKMKRWKLIPLQKCAFRRCSWNRRDVILFSVVRKITACRETRRELLGDEVMKTASHRNCPVQVTLIIEFEQLLRRAGNGSLFLHCKATLLSSVKIINQSVLCSTIQQSVKYEDSQQFVSRNLWTVGTAIHQIAIITYFTNFYDTFYATPCVPLWTEEIIAT